MERSADIRFRDEHKEVLDRLDKRLSEFSKTLVDVMQPCVRLVGTGGEQWRLEIAFSASGITQGFALNLLPEDLGRAYSDELVGDFLIELCSDLVEHKAASSFYQKNYDCIFEYRFNEGDFCLSSESGVCRFCDKGVPDVTFDTIAHAIPKSTGNLGLSSKRECDSCNQLFGRTIEANFGDFTNWQRALFRIGAKGVPAFVHKNSKIQVVDDETEIVLGTDSTARLKDDLTGLIIQMKNRGYTPAAVMYAFYKMAYTIMPEGELENFRHIRSWLKDSSCQQGGHYPLLPTHSAAEIFTPSCLLFRRKNNEHDKPYLTLVLLMGAVAYQVVIPAMLEKQNLECRLMRFANTFPSKSERHPQVSLHGTKKVKGEPISFTAAFVEDERAKIDKLPQEVQDMLRGTTRSG